LPSCDPVSERPIGEYLDAVREKSLIHPKTLESYSAALCKIASDVAGIDSNKGKRSTWRAQVDSIKLSVFTSETIEAWRASFIKRGAINPLKEKSAKVSANSFIGRARSLFGAEVVARVKDNVEIPSPAPFAGVKVERVRVPRYRSSFDMAALLESARTELATDRTELFKILLLASMVGLRRHEIDLLPWTSFRWDEEVIRIQATEHFRPKSHESETDIPVDRELLAIFRGYHARRRSEFVIESDCEPDVNAPYGHYRCHREFVELISWLRSKGVVSRTPLHALRKEYGSLVNQHFGLVAASEALRHADIKTTFNHYVENKQRSVLGFSHLLAKSDRTIIPLDDARATAK
jgi:integrase